MISFNIPIVFLIGQLGKWVSVFGWEEVTYLQGYKQRNAYILTQSPMTTTVVDMWRLLNDHESRAVIMLDDNDVTDDVRAPFPNH